MNCFIFIEPNGRKLNIKAYFRLVSWFYSMTDSTWLDITGLGGRGMSGDKAGDCSGKQLWREAGVGGPNLKRIRSPSPPTGCWNRLRGRGPPLRASNLTCSRWGKTKTSGKGAIATVTKSGRQSWALRSAGTWLAGNPGPGNARPPLMRRLAWLYACPFIPPKSAV